MSRATTLTERSSGDLRMLVEDYLTNGKYDPRKSQNRADDYKNARLTVTERHAVTAPTRKEKAKEIRTMFSAFESLVNNVPVPLVSNLERYNALKRPPIQQRHDVKKHQRNLRVPSALMQTNKLNGTRKTRYSHSKLQLSERVSGPNIWKEQTSS